MKQFMNDRLEKRVSFDFYQPMKKKGLKPFHTWEKLWKYQLRNEWYHSQFIETTFSKIYIYISLNFFLTNGWRTLLWSKIWKESLRDVQTEMLTFWWKWMKYRTKFNQEELDTRIRLGSHPTSIGGYQNLIVDTTETAELWTHIVLFGRPHCQLVHEQVWSTFNKFHQESSTFRLWRRRYKIFKLRIKKSVRFWGHYLGYIHSMAGAFCGKRKIKAFNLMLQDGCFIQICQSLGTLWDLTDEIYALAEQFACALYGHNRENDANTLRYKIYCSN